MFTIRRSVFATTATLALAGFAVLGVAAPASAATVSTASVCHVAGNDKIVSTNANDNSRWAGDDSACTVEVALTWA